MYDSLKFDVLIDGQYRSAELRFGLQHVFILDGVQYPIDGFSVEYQQDINENAEEPVGTEQA